MFEVTQLGIGGSRIQTFWPQGSCLYENFWVDEFLCQAERIHVLCSVYPVGTSDCYLQGNPYSEDMALSEINSPAL